MGSGEPFSKCLNQRKHLFGLQESIQCLLTRGGGWVGGDVVPVGHRDADRSLAQAEVG